MNREYVETIFFRFVTLFLYLTVVIRGRLKIEDAALKIESLPIFYLVAPKVSQPVALAKKKQIGMKQYYTLFNLETPCSTTTVRLTVKTILHNGRSIAPGRLDLNASFQF